MQKIPSSNSKVIKWEREAQQFRADMLKKLQAAPRRKRNFCERPITNKQAMKIMHQTVQILRESKILRDQNTELKRWVKLLRSENRKYRAALKKFKITLIDNEGVTGGIPY